MRTVEYLLVFKRVFLGLPLMNAIAFCERNPSTFITERHLKLKSSYKPYFLISAVTSFSPIVVGALFLFLSRTPVEARRFSCLTLFQTVLPECLPTFPSCK